MSAKTLAQDRYQQRARLARRTSLGMQNLWGQVDTTAVTESWRALLPRALRLLILSQHLSAVDAQAYMTAIVDAEGAASAPAATVITSNFAGRASDGRSLTSLLQLPPITVKQRLARGFTVQESMTSGLSQLVQFASTQVADAGRGADETAMVNDQAIQGYVRQLQTPSCSRCMILAGKFFRWNAGFQRHPVCDCIHRPTTADSKSDAAPQNPHQLFDDLTTEQQNRTFGPDDAQTIRDGGDMNRVVNAHRGMGTARRKTLTPASREAAINNLIADGYLA